VLLSGFTGCSMIACAKKLRWMYISTAMPASVYTDRHY
jgi:hypothetical protein